MHDKRIHVMQYTKQNADKRSVRCAVLLGTVNQTLNNHIETEFRNRVLNQIKPNCHLIKREVGIVPGVNYCTSTLERDNRVSRGVYYSLMMGYYILTTTHSY